MGTVFQTSYQNKPRERMCEAAGLRVAEEGNRQPSGLSTTCPPTKGQVPRIAWGGEARGPAREGLASEMQKLPLKTGRLR